MRWFSLLKRASKQAMPKSWRSKETRTEASSVRFQRSVEIKEVNFDGMYL